PPHLAHRNLHSFPTRRSSDLFDQILRDSRHIERDKRRFGSRTVAMQGMSDQFFTGAGFAVNQHANRRTRKPTDNTEHVLHGWRLDRKSTRLNSSHVSISYAAF